MKHYKVTLRASKAGSIGAKHVEVRTFEFDAADWDSANLHARALAAAQGLEHVLITSQEEFPITEK